MAMAAPCSGKAGSGPGGQSHQLAEVMCGRIDAANAVYISNKVLIPCTDPGRGERKHRVTSRSLAAGSHDGPGTRPKAASPRPPRCSRRA